MNRILSSLLILAFAAGLLACERREGIPIPRIGAGTPNQTATHAAPTPETRQGEGKTP